MVEFFSDTDEIDSSIDELRNNYAAVRNQSEQLAAPLPVEDQVVQSMADASPTKWHLAHTTWFFETFVLDALVDDYRRFRDEFAYLFNSYYQGAGPQFARPRRGTIGRPTVETIGTYRAHVDRAMQMLFDDGVDHFERWAPIVSIGLHHERQHQELILTDIKHALASNPLLPSYRDDCAKRRQDGSSHLPGKLDWLDIPGDTYEIGFQGRGFCFDNERPRHEVALRDVRIATRPVTCGEFAEFIADGGYGDSRWWLSAGWDWVEGNDIDEPLYWKRRGDEWWTMTLGGMRPVDVHEPMCHVNYFEADAYARWAGARLPTEAEWEIAAGDRPVVGNFAETERFHPASLAMPDTEQRDDNSPRFYGDVWEWTSSAYSPYPGFRPWDETLGEYNGKFMCNQYVLRGGCCASPQALIRPTYRNFFAPDARWQFSGFRLAK